jgi:hypothetical protein
MRIWNRSEKYPADAVYIGRGTMWGNPFRIGSDGTREAVIARYEDEIVPRLDLSFLRGRDLVCHCAPLPCHGDSIKYKLECEALV